MNPATKNNVLTWAVVILIAANVVVITLFWMAHHQQQQRLHESPADFLVRELGLNEKQKAQLKELANQHHMESQKIRGRIKDARDHFFDLMKSANVNPATKDSAADAIAQNLKQLELLTFDHFQKVRMICTPEQQVKFDKIIDEVMKMVGGPPAGPPPGGRHNGPGEGPPENDERPGRGDSPPPDAPPGG